MATAQTMTEITIETYIQAPAEVCFDLARDLAAHTESAAFSGERLVPPGKLSGLLDVGDLVCFEGRHFGITQRFCAKITRVERPHLFVDEMVQGAFTWLTHDHIFERQGTGTLMRDVLRWRSPLGILGRIADALFLERHMTWFVTTKQQQLKVIAERISRPAAT